MSHAFESGFREWSATPGRVQESRGGGCSQQINTDQVYLLCFLPFFLGMLLIDPPRGGVSSDSDTKQVPKENISFKRE